METQTIGSWLEVMSQEDARLNELLKGSGSYGDLCWDDPHSDVKGASARLDGYFTSEQLKAIAESLDRINNSAL